MPASSSRPCPTCVGRRSKRCTCARYMSRRSGSARHVGRTASALSARRPSGPSPPSDETRAAGAAGPTFTTGRRRYGREFSDDRCRREVVVCAGRLCDSRCPARLSGRTGRSTACGGGPEGPRRRSRRCRCRWRISPSAADGAAKWGVESIALGKPDLRAGRRVECVQPGGPQSTDHSAPPARMGGPAAEVDGPVHPNDIDRCAVLISTSWMPASQGT